MSGPRTDPQPSPEQDTARQVVGWAAFCCALVPLVLVWYGTSWAGAISATLGLSSVTAGCRALLRQSERGAAQLRAAALRDAPRGEAPLRRAEPGSGVRRVEPLGGGTPGTVGHVTYRRPHGWTDPTGAHRGGRRAGGNAPVR
ncbi:hypothetical protein ACWEQ1_01045 [Streptomyces nodosus]